MKNNKGLSYIELMLVVSIIVIFTGVASLSIGLISRSNVNKAVKELNSAFSRAQSMSMTKGQANGCLTIMVDNGKYYYYFGKDSANKVKFATSPCTIRLLNDSGTDVFEDSEGNPVGITYSGITYYFKTNTGSLDTPSTVPAGYNDACSCTRLEITSSGSNKTCLKINKLTGKSEID